MADPSYYFLFAMNNSGTTAMSQYLAAVTGFYLPPFGNNEGQMAPKVRRLMRTAPWNPATTFDWAEIRQHWDALLAKSGKSAFIEASPPNILRVAAIRREWGETARYAFSISDPYMQITSSLYNYTVPPLGPGRIAMATGGWITKARVIARARADNPDLPLISYEAFCANPAVLMGAYSLLPSSEASAIEAYAPQIAGKRTGAVRHIRNMASRNIAFLTFDELDQISDQLSDSADLLESFGFRLRRGEALIEAAWQEPALAHAGMIRRMQWERGQAQEQPDPSRSPDRAGSQTYPQVTPRSAPKPGLKGAPGKTGARARIRGPAV